MKCMAPNGTDLQAKDQRSEFDAETAIRVCRQAGYFSQALRLAQDRQKHDWYLKILLEDTCDYGRALQYIRTLPVQQVCSVSPFSSSRICRFKGWKRQIKYSTVSGRLRRISKSTAASCWSSYPTRRHDCCSSCARGRRPRTRTAAIPRTFCCSSSTTTRSWANSWSTWWVGRAARRCSRCTLPCSSSTCCSGRSASPTPSSRPKWRSCCSTAACWAPPTAPSSSVRRTSSAPASYSSWRRRNCTARSSSSTRPRTIWNALLARAAASEVRNRRCGSKRWRPPRPPAGGPRTNLWPRSWQPSRRTSFCRRYASSKSSAGRPTRRSAWPVTTWSARCRPTSRPSARTSVWFSATARRRAPFASRSTRSRRAPSSSRAPSAASATNRSTFPLSTSCACTPSTSSKSPTRPLLYPFQ